MPAALRYVKLALVPMLLMLCTVSPAAAQFDVDPDWEETPLQKEMRLGSWAYDEWELDKAEEHFRNALRLAGEEADEEEREYAMSYIRVSLVRVLDALHREEEALELHEIAMSAMLRPDTYLDDEDRADMHRTHANLQTQLALWDEAEESLERAFKHAQEWYGEDHPWALSYLVPKATIYMQTQRQGEAVDIHRRVIESYEEEYGRLNPGLMSALGAAAFDASLAGEDEQALAWYQWMLEIEANEYHDSDHQLFSRRHWIADLSANLGDFDTAYDHFDKIISTLEASFGDDNLVVASVYASLANARLAAGDLEEGLDAIDEGLEVLGDADEDRRLWIDLMMYRVNLLRLLDRNDDADEAMDELREILEDD